MDGRQLMAYMSEHRSCDPSVYDGFVPRNGVDHLALASAAFLASDTQLASKMITIALDESDAFVHANWFIHDIALHLPLELFENPALHPWFSLQKLFGLRAGGLPLQENATFETAQALADAILHSPFEARLCKERAFEEICENRLRPVSLDDAQTRNWLEAYLKKFGDEAPASKSFFSACLRHHAGDRITAEAEFRTFEAFGTRSAHFTLGARSYRATPCIKASTHKLKIARVAPGKTTVFTCDPGYFSKWFPVLRKALTEAPVDCSIHFHVIGSQDSLADFRDQLDDRRIGLSFEDDPELGSPYYASARFLAGPELLAAYGRPLLFSDIDCTFSPEIGKFLEVLRGTSAAFFAKRSDNHCPWRTIVASLFYITPGGPGEAVLAQARDYLSSLIAEGVGFERLWWCDQNALGYGYEVTGVSETSVSFFDLRQQHVPLPFTFAPNDTRRKEDFIKKLLTENI
jgi:hypothetical protein